MNCETLANNLTNFLEGELSEADELAAIEHLSTCSKCETVLGETQRVIALAHAHGRVSLTPNDRARLLTQLLEGIEK